MCFNFLSAEFVSYDASQIKVEPKEKGTRRKKKGEDRMTGGERTRKNKQKGRGVMVIP